MDTEILEILESKIAGYNEKGASRIEASEAQLRLISSYLKLLQAWNKKMDLVAPALLETWVDKHVMDSLIVESLVKDLLQGGVVDVGSGAGIPGVIFSIMNPGLRVCLVEPRDKRTVFLKEVKRELGLSELEVVRARFEELDGEEFSGVRVIVSRGTSEEISFHELARGLVKDGYLVRMLGPSWEESVSEKDLLLNYRYELPDGSSRKLVVWEL